MRFGKQDHLAWDRVWSSPAQRFVSIGRDIYNHLFLRALRGHTSNLSAILEVGCGGASLLRMLAPSFKSAVGLDLSGVALRKASEAARDTPVSFVRGDCFRLPFADHSFDVVWSQGLLEHFEAPDQILREQLRACKPGGVVISSVPYRFSYFALWYVLTRPRPLRRFWPWTEQGFFTIESLRRLGARVCPNARVYVLRPFPMGILVLEMRKEKE